MNIFEPQTNLRKFKLSFAEIDQGLPEVLIGDQIRLKQILINLMNYVLKNSVSRVVKFEASYDAGDKQLLVKLCDKGAGMDVKQV